MRVCLSCFYWIMLNFSLLFVYNSGIQCSCRFAFSFLTDGETCQWSLAGHYAVSSFCRHCPRDLITVVTMPPKHADDYNDKKEDRPDDK